ncbi:AhpC/TSA family protein [Nocardia sp. NPDC046763]|uniref:AhpC/TSA family protein n=1 Tax=Nocardia sp. NPDC046763 TaxID=3155256 RepID=UPI0033CD1B8F
MTTGAGDRDKIAAARHRELVAGHLAARTSVRAVLTCASALIATGSLLLVTLHGNGSWLESALPPLPFGAGVGLAFGVMDNAAVSTVPVENAGVAAGIVNTMRITGESVAGAAAPLTTLTAARLRGSGLSSESATRIAGTWIGLPIAAGLFGVTEVVVFHSVAEELRRYQSDLPFAVVADPQQKLYAEFGVESSAAALAYPRAWLAAARGAARQRSISGALGRGEDHFGRPADFLIGPDGRIVARKYGAHADDQWSVDEIISLAGHYRSA